MINLKYERTFKEGVGEVWAYKLTDLPHEFSEGMVEIVNMGAQVSGTKVFYARVHLLTVGTDLITMTTTSQGEWLTKKDCVLRVRRFLNQIEKGVHA